MSSPRDESVPQVAPQTVAAVKRKKCSAGCECTNCCSHIDSSSDELHEIAIEEEHTNFLVGDVDDIVDFVFGIEASDRLSQHINSTFQLDSDRESYLSDSEGNYSDSDSEEAMTDD